MLKQLESKATGDHHSARVQARALARVLGDEFGALFILYDAQNGEAVWGGERATDTDDQDASSRAEVLDSQLLGALLTDGRPLVSLRAETFQLALLIHQNEKPTLAAVAEVKPQCSGTQVIQEQARLQRWLQAVSDRLRLTDQLASRRQVEEAQNHQLAHAWESILTLDHLVRRLRIHKDPVKNRGRILEAAFRLAGVETLVWVPDSLEAPVRVVGQNELASSDWRRLASALAQTPELQAQTPLLCNDFTARAWSSGFPCIHGLLAFAVSDQNSIGWLIAVNKRNDAGKRGHDGAGKGRELVVEDGPGRGLFRKSDAALLAPFVSLLGLHARSSERYQDLKDLLVGLTRSLTSALDAKDSYTYGHSERVARIAIELGREMGLQEDDLGDIYLAGLLHDVGKIGIHDSVLHKPAPLTPEEFEHVKKHVTIGYRILADLRPIRNLLPGVLHHHEHFDGTGYPDGLAGENIPLLARILAVADAYDAMSTARPYREAMPCRKVEETLVSGGGKQWDQRIIDAFQRCRQKVHAIRQRGVGESLCQAIDGALRSKGSSVDFRSELLTQAV